MIVYDNVMERARYQLRRHAALITVTLVVGCLAASWLLAARHEQAVRDFFKADAQFAQLRSLYQTLGGALLGATAFVSSLVLFSMQVNVERMPHGLFRRLSSDRRLVAFFLTAFLLAVLVPCLAMIPTHEWALISLFACFWAVVFILASFYFAYRRALDLVNPLKQVELLLVSTKQDFARWGRRADRAAPLLSESFPSPTRAGLAVGTKTDVARFAFFNINPHWTQSARRSLRYTVSIARRYAEQGDHEVSSAAINATVLINAAYVRVRGRTFFADNPFIPNPMSSDAFTTETLEHLRQSARIAISRGDEQQIEDTLGALAGLVRVYSAIDYGSEFVSKTHAHIAAGYLTNEVERIIPHNMPDVLMQACRLMGQCAEMLMLAEGPDGAVALIRKIALVGCSGALKEDYRPLTKTGLEQLARIDESLLRIGSRDIRHAARELRDSVMMITQTFLTVPEQRFSTHSSYLSQYYSDSLRTLEVFVGALGEAKSDNPDALKLIRNLALWSEGLYEPQKMLLLEAVSRKSSFTGDAFHYIGGTTKLLLTLSVVPACPDGLRADLQKNALWLISVTSFVPDEIETVRYVETYRVTEALFEVAAHAYRAGCTEIAEKVDKLLLSWMFKGGKHQSGWGILERALCGLATLALMDPTGAKGVVLKQEIQTRVSAGELPDPEVKSHAAEQLRERASRRPRGYLTSSIDIEMAKLDRDKISSMLQDLADLIWLD